MEPRPDTVVVYQDQAGEWRWRRVAPNGEKISDGAEGYTRKGDATEAAKRSNPDGVELEIHQP